MSIVSNIYLQLTLFIVSLLINALFSFIETSVTALRLFRLRELARNVGRYPVLFTALEKDPHRILITTLIINSAASASASALVTHIMERVFEELNLSGGLGFSVGVAIATLALLIFSEIIPKNIAKSYGDRVFPSTLWILNAAFQALYPVVTVLNRFSALVIDLLRGKRGDQEQESVASEQEIQFLIDYIAGQGRMEAEKTEMLQSIFDLSRTPVKEIIVPQADMISISASTTLEEAMDAFLKYRFSRFPVYEGEKDNIIGMVHQKDVFQVISRHEKKTLRDILRPILFIPENIKINQLLREFKQERRHIGIVIDEYGAIIGLVTLEDILEEIVGEIRDEHEVVTHKIVPLEEGGWMVDASVELEELGELLGITFDAERALSLGGFLTEQLNHLPKKGERVLYKGYRFQVQKATPKRVSHVLVIKCDDDEACGQQHTAAPKNSSSTPAA